MPCGRFLANRPNEPKSQSDIASRPLPKSSVSSSPYDVVPQMIVRSPHVRPGKFAIGDAKRVLQQNRSKKRTLIDAIEESERCRYRQPAGLFVNLLNRINVTCLVHPLSKKYFRFRLTQISSCPPTRGVS